MDKKTAIGKVRLYKQLLQEYFDLEKDNDKGGFLEEIEKYGIEV